MTGDELVSMILALAPEERALPVMYCDDDRFREIAYVESRVVKNHEFVILPGRGCDNSNVLVVE